MANPLKDRIIEQFTDCKYVLQDSKLLFIINDDIKFVRAGKEIALQKQHELYDFSSSTDHYEPEVLVCCSYCIEGHKGAINAIYPSLLYEGEEE